MDIELQSLLPLNNQNKEILWKYDENIDRYYKYCQYKDKIEKNISIFPQNCLSNKDKQNNKKLPIDFALEIFETDKEYIKSKLIEFISIKEFQSIFGIKKTSEIMKGITEDKWNKSLVIFYSFLFDISFVYLKKDVVFDKSKNYYKKVII